MKNSSWLVSGSTVNIFPLRKDARRLHVLVGSTFNREDELVVERHRLGGATADVEFEVSWRVVQALTNSPPASLLAREDATIGRKGNALLLAFGASARVPGASTQYCCRRDLCEVAARSAGSLPAPNSGTGKASRQCGARAACLTRRAASRSLGRFRARLLSLFAAACD